MGVWKFLKESGWIPDMVCGTSVGAINACAIGSDLEMEKIELIWQKMERSRVYRMISLTDLILKFKKKDYTPYMNPAPLEKFISEIINFKKLRSSAMEVIITAVNVNDSTLHFFKNRTISLDHIMASSAIPLLFPWRMIKNKPYWDGGVMMNTPLLPALKAGAKEIVLVLSSPVGGRDLPLPESSHDVMERFFEQSLIASFQSTLSCLDLSGNKKNLNGIDIIVVSPVKMMGFQSILNFSTNQTEDLVKKGYEDASSALRSHFKKLNTGKNPASKKTVSKKKRMALKK